MIVWDKDGKSSVYEGDSSGLENCKDISGVSDDYARGTCPFCRRSYSQEYSCYHLQNILPVEGEAYWHREFIKTERMRFIACVDIDNLNGPLLLECAVCNKNSPKESMVHVIFVSEHDVREQTISYCSLDCAKQHWAEDFGNQGGN